MPLDPSFRSRLRDALDHSVVGRRATTTSEASSEPPHELRYVVEDERQDAVERDQAARIADGLGGWWSRDAGGLCLVVDRVYDGDRAHGDATIGDCARALLRYQRTLRTFDGVAAPETAPTLFTELDTAPDPAPCPDEEQLLFFDLETTGLSGGAGICAFLIGYGWFDRDCFRTRQYFLSGFGHEAAMLRLAADPLGVSATRLNAGSTGGGADGKSDAEVGIGSAGAAHDFSRVLTSFNGKTFDVPLITGRYLFHRLPCPFDGIAHIDLLHPARRLWRHRPAEPVGSERRDAFARYFRMTRSATTRLAQQGQGRTSFELSASAASCALGALEEAVLGFSRHGDIPGADIPTRYFHYVRTGDVRPLVPVLEHNRLDLVSLAALASRVAEMLQEGAGAAHNSHECLALGRLYERTGAGERATACYQKVVDGDDQAAWQRDACVEREALRRLALRHRRDRRYQEAAAVWQRLVDVASAHAMVDFEAIHALAVHHEHRSKDLETARALVIRALDVTRDARTNDALRRRLARIERKIGQ